MRIFLSYLFLIFFFSYPAFAQNTGSITGTILSAKDDKPLPNATIKIKGTTQSVQSDERGMFQITTADPAAVLLVSFIGYQEQEFALGPQRKNIVIRLQENTIQFKDIIVSTGYQDIPRERSTGSFSKVDNTLFNQQVGPSVLSRLEAVANGLTVDRKTPSGGIQIRGLSTIQGVKGPLIVLDNFPYEGNIDNINPNDVENITILKDAAAASIWGTKAGNGVIVITTKKGRYGQPLQVDFNANVTLGTKPDLSYARQMSSADYVDLERSLFAQGAYDSQIASQNHPALTPVVETLLALRNQQITGAEAEARLAAFRQNDARSDYRQYVYSTAVNQQYALGIRGGTESVSWMASGGYDRNIGNLSEKFSRLNLRYQSTYRLLKRLELGTEFYYTQSTGTSGKPGYGSSTYGAYPYVDIAGPRGEALPVARDYSQSYLGTLGNTKLLSWSYFPLNDWEQDRALVKTQDLILNVNLKYRIIPGLTAELRYQHERQNVNTEQDHGTESYFTRNLINRFSQVDANGIVSYRIPPGAIFDRSESSLRANNGRAQLTYHKSWGNHSITAIAGGEIRENETSSFQFRNYGVNPLILTTGNVDYLTAYPTLVTQAQEFIPKIDGFGGTVNRFVSLFSNAAYTYKEKYTISASGRRDASNLFGVNTNDKWTPLWSGGAAWNMSKESFYSSDLLPLLKARVTYGFSGNADPSRTGITIISLLGNSEYTGGPLGRIERYGNPELRWEKIATTNLGIDFGFKDNRLTGSIEYYRKKAKDLFGLSPMDYTTGVISITKNVASMVGHGIDVELNSVNLNGALGWTTNLNFSTYKDKIVTYYNLSQQGSNFVGSSSAVGISGLEGKPVYSLLSYRWAGLDPQTGDPQGILNGQVSKDYAALTGPTTKVGDLIYSGPALPTVYGSLGNTVTWKGLSLTARLVYKFGNYFRKPTVSYAALTGSGIGDNDYDQRWQVPRDELSTSVPSFQYPASLSRDNFYAGSAVNVLKGDNIRLQYLTLSYDLNKGQLRRVPFAHLNLYVNVSNLGIIWKANKAGIDPDYPFSSFPPAKTYALGIRGNF